MGLPINSSTTTNPGQNLSIQPASGVNIFFKAFEPTKLQILFTQYEKELCDLRETVSFFKLKGKKSISTLINANLKTAINTSALFELEPAIKCLDSNFWKQALNLTDVYNLMPQSSREIWDKDINENTTPSFDKETVLITLKSLLEQRELFLAQQVDEVFQSLSGEHLTNSPSGFRQKMIMAPKFNNKNQEPSYTCMGHITDLRNIIAILQGNPLISLITTKKQVEIAYNNPGVWTDIDGGAIRFKVFKVGTVHLNVHPDMAWRLNKLLAILYPEALPPSVRKRPVRECAKKKLITNLISDGAICAISRLANPLMHKEGQASHHKRTVRDTTLFCFPRDTKKQVIDEVGEVLRFCGGIKEISQTNCPGYRFPVDFDFEILRNELILNRHIPEYRSHQFYETPESVAKLAVELCDIKSKDKCIEPSAGQGGLALFMPKRTLCIEISPIQCGILAAKGHCVVNADFLQWSKTAEKVDKIVMNPPFDYNQSSFHVLAAASLLNKDGKLVAILPSNLKGHDFVPDMHHCWGEPIEKAFENTNISVVTLVLTHKS